MRTDWAGSALGGTAWIVVQLQQENGLVKTAATEAPSRTEARDARANDAERHLFRDRLGRTCLGACSRLAESMATFCAVIAQNLSLERR
jgi:hypothetical protein